MNFEFFYTNVQLIVCVCMWGVGGDSGIDITLLRGKTVGRRETSMFPHSAPNFYLDNHYPPRRMKKDISSTL